FGSSMLRKLSPEISTVSTIRSPLYGFVSLTVALTETCWATVCVCSTKTSSKTIGVISSRILPIFGISVARRSLLFFQVLQQVFLLRLKGVQDVASLL